MKRLIAFFLITLFVLTVATNAFAQEIVQEEMAASNYDLPYPGMLPDHPLYKVKTLRNKIILFLIRDPLKKADKYLELADKEFFAALKLAEKDKLDLAQHAAFKAEHNVTLIVTEVKRAAYSGQDLDYSFLEKVYRAGEKHREILAGIANRTSNETQMESLAIIQEFSLRNEDELTKLQEELELEELNTEDFE